MMNSRLWLLPLLTSLTLAGCGGDDNKNGNNSAAEDNGSSDSDSYSTLQVNASGYSSWQYIDLENGTVLDLDDDSAASSSAWHIALQRYNIKLNGGDSGPGNVQGALADAQEEFYDSEGNANASVFSNANADTEAAALAVSYDTSSLSWQADANTPAMSGWYSYDMTTHSIAADTSVGFLVRHADGSTYSRVLITSINASGVSLSYTTQAADTVQLADSSLSLSATFADDASSTDSTRLCLDLDSAAAVDCASSDDWEWMYQYDASARAVNIWTNGAIYGSGNAAVFGPIDATELASYTSATNVNGTAITSHYSSDSSSGLFSSDSWYAYNLLGGHKIWPNFRTWVIDLDSSNADSQKISLQISDYYSLGDSGSPEIRFRPLATGE